MVTGATLLRQVRHGAGLSLRALARNAGTAPSRLSEISTGRHDPGVGTLERVVRAAGYQLAVLPTSAPSAATVAVDIIDHAADRDADAAEEYAFRALLSLSDGLEAAEPAVRVALSVTPAPPTGDQRIDAALAGIVEHHLGDGLPVPAWVKDSSRYLDVPWTPDPYASATVADHTPAALREHGVLLDAAELVSV